MSLLDLPGLRIRAGTLSAIHSRRPLSSVVDDGMILVILEAGSATARHRGCECTFSAGEAILTANDATFVGHAPTKVVNLRFERRKLDLLDTDARILRPLPRSNHALQLLSAYTNLVLGLPAPPLHAARLAADHIYDLAALALGVARDREHLGSVAGVRAARLAAALTIIRAAFDDPTLAPATVAAQLGISTRYLHKLLQETGSSFSQRVQDLRLAKAFGLLSGQDRKPARIIEAAHAAGFNDVSHFNRIFRRKYGLTPTAIRGRDRPRVDQDLLGAVSRARGLCSPRRSARSARMVRRDRPSCSRAAEMEDCFLRKLLLILAVATAAAAHPTIASASYCEELRLACEHKYSLGEVGAGNCKAYRQTCQRPVSCRSLRYYCLHKDEYGLGGQGYCQTYRDACR